MPSTASEEVPTASQTEPQPAPRTREPSPEAARIPAVDLARIAWLVTTLACLVTALILLLEGYYGYAGVTFAVAVSAGINLA